MLKRLLNRTLLAACLLIPAGAAAQQPAAAPAEERERGATLLKAGDYKGASLALREAVKKDKRDADAWHLLGVSLVRADDAKGARKAFETTLKLRPDSAPARSGLAYSLLVLGKYRDAEREAMRALAANPLAADALYVTAAVRYRESKFAEAASSAEAALRLDPTFPAAARLAGDALLNHYLDESSKHFERHPVKPGADEAERKAAREAFAVAHAPLKARMLDVANLMESVVKARPDLEGLDAWRDLIDMLRYYGRPPGQDPPAWAAGIFSTDQVTTKAVILQKPEPSFTERARRNNVTGLVRLRAVLGADGRVGRILVLRRLPDGLTEKAIAAAREIKFTPATRDGRPVSQFIVLEYHFNVY